MGALPLAEPSLQVGASIRKLPQPLGHRLQVLVRPRPWVEIQWPAQIQPPAEGKESLLLLNLHFDILDVILAHMMRPPAIPIVPVLGLTGHLIQPL